MAGPWEKFAAPQETGPWTKFSGAAPQVDAKAAARAKIHADEAAWQQKIKDDLKESGGYLENYGAGVDSLVQGVKQLFGKGDDDATIEERRRTKKELAEGRLGGGLTQLAGEVVTSAPVLSGAGAVAGRTLTALPKVGQALKALGMAGGRTFNVGNVAQGAAQGAAMGAAGEVTSDESRGLNATVGGVLGAAAPGVLAAASKVKNMLGKGNAPVRAATQFEKQLGAEGMEQVTDAAVSPTKTVLPLSTAARSQNVKLAALERGARSRSDWGFNHDKTVAEKAWAELKDVTKAADDLGARTEATEALVKASKSELDKIADPAALGRASDHVASTTQSLRSSPAGRQNPDLNATLGQVEEMLKHPDRTAGDFASQYWRLDKMVDSASGEAKAALVKLRDAVKEGADLAAGGPKFTDLLGKVNAAKSGVTTSEAAQGVRGTFMSDEGVAKTAREWGGTPEIGSSALRMTMAKRGGAMNTATREGGERLAKELGQHELHLAKNSPGVSALGVENPLSIISSGRDNPFNYFPLVKGGANWLFGGSRKATTDAADSAMQNPEAWKAMVDAYAKSKTPLTKQEYLARALRQASRLPGQIGAAEFSGD